jgi:soluble lytic murein transglycosylase-like protein
MKGLLIAASVWSVIVGVAIGRPGPAESALMPALRFPAQQAAYMRALTRLMQSRARTDRYDSLIARESARRGLDPRLVKAVIAAESDFSPAARSPVGAKGLMQLMPETAAEVGVHGDLHDPALSIKAGTAYLALLHSAAFRQHGIEGRRYAHAPVWLQRQVVASYNFGPRALKTSKWPAETRLYVEKVMFYYRTEMARLRPAAVTAAR